MQKKYCSGELIYSRGTNPKFKQSGHALIIKGLGSYPIRWLSSPRVHRTANRRVRTELCEQAKLYKQCEVRNSSHWTNSVNGEPCEQFTLNEQCEKFILFEQCENSLKPHLLKSHLPHLLKSPNSNPTIEKLGVAPTFSGIFKKLGFSLGELFPPFFTPSFLGIQKNSG